MMYANSHRQPLVEHVFAVAVVSYELTRAFYRNEELALSAFMSGLFHDLGKTDPIFQKWLLGKDTEQTVIEDGEHIDKPRFGFNSYPRHNEISYLLAELLNVSKGLPATNLVTDILHGVFWHHGQPPRKTPFARCDDIYRSMKAKHKERGMKALLEQLNDFLDDLVRFQGDYFSALNIDLMAMKSTWDEDRLESLMMKGLPEYKDYREEKNLESIAQLTIKNSRRNIIRAMVISADRLISNLTANELTSVIEGNLLSELAKQHLVQETELSESLTNCLERFKNENPQIDRNIAQTESAKELHEVEGIAVLNGPAGCGKTKIGLEWASLGEATTLLWVCPRVQVCEGIYRDLTAYEYLRNEHIELYTGEKKVTWRNGKEHATEPQEAFTGNVVITTIDQLLNTITTHHKVTNFVHYLKSHVIFDEFHEYITMPGYNLLFKELINSKDSQSDSYSSGFGFKEDNTLLVSATPNKTFLNGFMDLDESNVVQMTSFNRARYQVSIEAYEDGNIETSPLFEPQDKSTFVIFNSAIQAQLSFIKNQSKEKALLFHSRYTKADKTMLSDAIYRNFGEKGRHQYALRSGPIVQASLNIGCLGQMLTELSNAEDCMQRFGRDNRFGVKTGVVPFRIIYDAQLLASQGNIKKSGSTGAYLNYRSTFKSTYAWLVFLQQNCPEFSVTVNEMYDLYLAFHETKEAKKAIKTDLIKSLNEGIALVTDVIKGPLFLPSMCEQGKSDRLKASSLRGESRYVEMATGQVTLDGQLINFGEQYLGIEGQSIMTMDINEVRGFDQDDKNLMSEMYAVHKKLGKYNHAKMPRTNQEKLTLGAARLPNAPLYLSFTNEDLVKANKKAHKHAIYYAHGEHQPIGAMSVHRLLTAQASASPQLKLVS